MEFFAVAPPGRTASSFTPGTARRLSRIGSARPDTKTSLASIARSRPLTPGVSPSDTRRLLDRGRFERSLRSAGRGAACRGLRHRGNLVHGQLQSKQRRISLVGVDPNPMKS
jgi:hypothetical protein